MLLIVSDKKSRARDMAEVIRRLGIVCYPATAGEVFSEISPMYRAILVIEPSELADAKAFVQHVKQYNSRIPIYALVGNKNEDHRPYFDATYNASDKPCNLIEAIATNTFDKGLKFIGSYKLCGIDATVDLPAVTFFDNPLSLTKRQAMILRLLIRTYPNPVKPKYIVKHLYKPSLAPEETCIRAHICAINKHFSEFTDGNLIRPIGREGYVIYTPEMKKLYGEQ